MYKKSILIPAISIVGLGLIVGFVILPMTQEDHLSTESVKKETKCKMLNLKEDDRFYQFDCGSYYSLCDRNKDSKIQTYSGCLILTKPTLRDSIITNPSGTNSTENSSIEKMNLTLEKIFFIIENYPNRLSDDEIDVLISYAVGRGYNSIDIEVDEKAMDIMLRLVAEGII